MAQNDLILLFSRVADYSPGSIPTTVTIPASELRACFTGSIIDDRIGLEDDESFNLTITGISPNIDVIRLGRAMTQITINDDDSELRDAGGVNLCYWQILQPFFSVVRVRYEEPTYIFREEIGQATVCLIKDLETAVGLSVDSITSPHTALGM